MRGSIRQRSKGRWQKKKDVGNMSAIPKIQSVKEPFNSRFSFKKWSQRMESNHRPAVYETAALPLSYAGFIQV